MRYALLGGALLFVILTAVANDRRNENQAQFPPTYVPSGQQIYQQFCAACHGVDAKGNGPTASRLKTPPPDLTTLPSVTWASFPMITSPASCGLGPGPSTHGSTDMPTWGPIFQIIDKNNERAVRQRIKNLSDYLASLQEGSGGMSTIPAAQ